MAEHDSWFTELKDEKFSIAMLVYQRIISNDDVEHIIFGKFGLLHTYEAYISLDLPRAYTYMYMCVCAREKDTD